MSVVWIAYCSECDGQLTDNQARIMDEDSTDCPLCKED